MEADRKLSRLTNAMSKTVSHYSDEELPESPESSPDEDFGAKNNLEGCVLISASKSNRKGIIFPIGGIGSDTHATFLLF